MKRFITLLALPALLAACAGPGLRGLPAGLTEAEIVARWGPPPVRHSVPGGSRLEYSSPPEGLHTWMVDLDARGVSTGARDVLNFRHLEAVQGTLPGMTREQLLATIGRPSQVRTGGRQPGEVWSWRHDSPFCLWFQVSINTSGFVKDASFAPDPRCEFQDM